MTKKELINKRVWWNDPEGFSSGWYDVFNVRCDDEDVIEDDTIVEISRGELGNGYYSEAEVTYDEITFIELD